MREIKFRAWNGKTMISPDYIDRQGIAHWYENSIPESTKHVMQYTEFKDCKGKEIYDDDILFFPVYQVKGVVKWHEQYSCWYVDLLYRTGDQRSEGTLFDFRTSIGWEDNIEVIGNIYENPELTEKA